MRDMKLFLELIARSAGFKSELTSSGRAVTRFTDGAKREFAALKRMAGGLTGSLAGIGVSLGTVQLLKQSAMLDKSLTQIGQTAGAGAGKVKALRGELFTMGKETGQDVDSLKDGFNSLVQSGLNMGEARATLEGVNVAMAVSGANAKTLADGLTVAAANFQFDLAKPGKALELLDKMVVAGRLGNAELESLSSIFSRVGANAQSAGMSFDKTLAFVEALSMVERNPERLGTLSESTLRLFNNDNYRKQAQAATGVRFYDAKGARRDPLAVLSDLRKGYSKLNTDLQRTSFINAAFGKADLDTIKGLRTLLQSNTLDKLGSNLKEIGKSGGTLNRDLSEATANAVDQAGRLKNALREAADSFAQPINKTIAEFIAFSMASKKDGGLELDGKDMIMGGVGIAAGTAIISRYLGKYLGGLANKRLGNASSLAIGVAEGKALQAAAGVTPVAVVNWPDSLGGAGILPGNVSQGAPGKMAGWAKAGASIIMLAGGYFLVKEAVAHGVDNGWGAQAPTARERQVMGIAPVQNDITLNVRIDPQGRVFSDTTSMATRSRTTLKRGEFMAAH